MISSSDFNNWKQDPVTKAFFTACEERVQECLETLGSCAGLDPTYDSFLRGFIAAYNEIPAFRLAEDE